MRIKKIIDNLFGLFAIVWSYIYSYSISRKIANKKNILYSAWISKEFKSLGKNTIIYPLKDLVGGKYISIGERCTIGKCTVLTAWDKYGSDSFMPQIIIGNNVSIGDDSHITSINKIEIGNNVLTGKKVTITDNAHGKSVLESLLVPPIDRALHSSGPVIIEDNVWIGDKVSILSNTRIGKNSIIGANAVVTKNIPPNSLAVGNPAKVIKIIN
jgi:acetyltransferase-like isoleucine patch superfamily enzyme